MSSEHLRKRDPCKELLSEPFLDWLFPGDCQEGKWRTRTSGHQGQKAALKRKWPITAMVPISFPSATCWAVLGHTRWVRNDRLRPWPWAPKTLDLPCPVGLEELSGALSVPAASGMTSAKDIRPNTSSLRTVSFTVWPVAPLLVFQQGEQ